MSIGTRLLALGTTTVIATLLLAQADSPGEPAEKKTTALPKAATTGKMSLEETLAKRRSVRSFKTDPLTTEQIAQLSWSAQGISDAKRGYRTCPSAGATYPLELYVVTPAGVDHYHPKDHALRRHLDGDVRGALREAALGQGFVGSAPATFVIAGVRARTERRYARRAERYVIMEVGHAGQNLLLQAVALNLAAVPVGAFRDEDVAKALNLPKDHAPLYLIPVGAAAGG